MPGTPRKASPKVQPVKVVPSGEGDTTPVETVERFNIADILAVGTEKPYPITLFGVDAEVRRTFTGEEAVKFFALAGEKDYGTMLDLITDSGSALWEKIGGLNPTHASTVLNKIIELSGLFEGKLLAPLPAYSQGMAGARPLQGSSPTTD
ncbi:hypothetical protein HQO43_12615 [Rhodococcus fascians]|nr:hypothetical protein [Rhodococcus fascians]MBY4269153.1 hypothetical protein [Rhodococcus fascians]